LELAQFCLSYKRRPDLAVKLYAEAFATTPQLANDLAAAHRYNAACAAALTAARTEENGQLPTDERRQELREQALAWLRAELAAMEDAATQPPAKPRVVAQLSHWRSDPDLASVREMAALAALSEAEREAWQALWADVERLVGP
jgi:hypothetical protein